MFGKEKKPERFVVKETQGIGVCCLSVICDTETGVNYLASGEGLTYSHITPLLDHNGNVVIDPIGPQY